MKIKNYLIDKLSNKKTSALVHEITDATPSGTPLLSRYGVVLGIILMQSMIGDTLRHSVQLVQSSVT